MLVLQQIAKGSGGTVLACWSVMVEPGRLLLAYSRHAEHSGIWCTVGVFIVDNYGESKASLVFKHEHWNFRSCLGNAKFIVDPCLCILYAKKQEHISRLKSITYLNRATKQVLKNISYFSFATICMY